MNQYGYPEKYMYSQTDWRWAFRKLTPYSKNMKEIGCALTSLAYIISRHDKKDITPGTFLDWIAQKAKDAKYKDYMTSDGRVYWNAVDKFTAGTLVSCGSAEKKYTLVEVYWGPLRHWMVELKNGLVMNPYGYKVEPLKQPKWYPTGRKQFYKAV